MPHNDIELIFSGEGQVARLVLPGGALTAKVAAGLAGASMSLIENREVRVVVVSSRSDDFCTGPAHDLDVLDLRPDPASALAALRPPIISAISGQCRSEGLELVLATDIRVGGPTSTYALSHAAEGRVPAWGGTQRLPRAIRPGAAIAMALVGDSIDAKTAHGLGLIHHVTENVEDEIERLVATLCGRGPLALELTKEAVHRGSELPLRDGLRLEGDLNHQLAISEDRAEGLQAFFEKRPPDFSGR